MIDPNDLSTLSDKELLRVLRELHDKGDVAMEIRTKALEHIDSPVAIEADGNIWVYALVVIVAAIWWWQGTPWGLGAIAVGLTIYYTLGRAWIRRRLVRRVREKAFFDIDQWRTLWRLGGITLTAGPGESDNRCAAPEGNWMEFVRRRATSPS